MIKPVQNDNSELTAQIDSLTHYYDPVVRAETRKLALRYFENCPVASSTLAPKQLWTDTNDNIPLSRFAKAGATEIAEGQPLSPELATVTALVVALKIHSQYTGMTAVLSRLAKPASHSILLASERNFLQTINYILI